MEENLQLANFPSYFRGVSEVNAVADTLEPPSRYREVNMHISLQTYQIRENLQLFGGQAVGSHFCEYSKENVEKKSSATAQQLPPLSHLATNFRKSIKCSWSDTEVEWVLIVILAHFTFYQVECTQQKKEKQISFCFHSLIFI